MPLFVLLLCLFASATLAEQGFVGTAVCKSCHQEQWQQWQNSHHDLAMQSATPDTVLGDFNNASFTYNGITTRFTRKDDRFFITTDGTDGKLAEFPVMWVFGVYPLQQYLLPLPGGRLQAFNIAWDSRPKVEGGQRWYHLYPNEKLSYQDPLHWTGFYHNWNASCAECHVTDFKKNYHAKTNTYQSTFAEDTVGCEACHGPGKAHIDLLSSGKYNKNNTGLLVDLEQRGQWAFLNGSMIATQIKAPEHSDQLPTCARCHSRRGTLGDYHYGADLLDTHRLSLPVAPLYYHDGQVLDEDYVYGSFLQSKMAQAGVVCSNCHEPHSLKLRALGNNVCAQCHLPVKYDTPKHTFHEPNTPGGECVSCHMPETVYMGVDARRDHRFGIPRPDLSEKLGVPNACNSCHEDKTPAWAVAAMKTWGVALDDQESHRATAFARASRGDERAVPALQTVVADSRQPAIWRAAAIETLGGLGQSHPQANMMLASKDSVLRLSVVRSLDAIPLPSRYRLLADKLADPVLAVRMAMSESLAAVPVDKLPAQQRSLLLKIFKEYERIQSQHADNPGMQLQLADFYRARGDTVRAGAAYERAIALNRQLVPAYLNYADLQRQLGFEREAEKQLQSVLSFAPENAPTLHALGLLKVRANEQDKALEYLSRAALNENNGTRYRYIYAIALHDFGKPQQAITVLKQALADAPENAELKRLLVAYEQ